MTGVDSLLAESGALAWARWEPNPDNPQAAKTASIDAKEMKAAQDSLTIGDSIRSDSVVASTRNSGTKNTTWYRAGSGGIGG